MKLFGYIIGLILSNIAYFALHITGGNSFPSPLSEKEESEALEKMKEGDMQARQKLIEHNLRLVAHLSKKYYSAVRDQDDIISIGTVGLIKGIDSFNPEKNIKLATYASRCIENEILMFLRKSRRWLLSAPASAVWPALSGWLPKNTALPCLKKATV